MQRGNTLIFGVMAAWLAWVPVGAGAAEGRPLIVAGSGSSIPLMTQLAKAYRVRHPDVPIEVPKSIGSAGGIKAAADGGIDLGLSSRLPEGKELAYGLIAVPYARVSIVMAANPSVTDEGISTQDLIDIVQGTKTTWRDGREIVVLMRQADESNNTVLKDGVAGLGPVLDEAIRAKRWRILFHEHEMIEALAKTPYSIGVSDAGNASAAALKMLNLDGVAPTRTNVERGRYRLTKTLYVLHRPDVSAPARAFLTFIRSAQGATVIATAGYWPLP